MAQVNSNAGSLGRLTMRTIAMIVGLVGTAVALVINILYSLAHVLGRVSGITDDSSHFFFGLLAVLVALGGSFLTVFTPLLAAAMLLAAGIGFFFVVGWWALIASPFLFVAALLAFSNRRVTLPRAAA
jgi:hypothetical protein